MPCGRSREKIDVRAIDELRRVDAERGHETMRLRDPGLELVTVRHQHLELEQLAEFLVPIEMDARPPDQVEGALLAHAPGLVVRERQRLAEGIRRRRRRDDEERFLRARLIRAAIEDQLS